MTVTTVLGAQYGSEGKGVVVRHMADEYDVCVRVGAPNAGHSFVWKDRLWKMQAIPCGWINPKASLLLGPGALVSLDILRREIEMIREIYPDIMQRLRIDPRAGILEPRHHKEEGGVDGHLHKTIGSTGEGVGTARIDKMRRDVSKFRNVVDAKEEDICGIPLGEITTDIPSFLAEAMADDKNIMLEGTQGFGLSHTHGEWPHVTTSCTTAGQICADCGIPPMALDEVVLVVRTYPIRVAGPSGPLKDELTWDEMSQRVGRTVKEHTTVTKKPRRIGEWDEKIVDRAVTVNGPTSLAVTFIDYLSPGDEGKTKWDDLSSKSRSFVEYLEQYYNVPVTLIGTGFSEKTGWVCIQR